MRMVRAPGTVQLLEADPDLELTIDVERLVLSAPKVGIEAAFPLDPSTQERFLEGLDDIALSLRHDAEIGSFEARRPTHKPSVSKV